jgi:endogenous inhibitor of DNA gyrase (YacG/DUF329 family)
VTAVRRCPTCKHPAAPWPENAAFPFCSPRCKLVDLGNWLDERYRIPAAEGPSEEDADDGRASRERATRGER